jgi:hypothetical protein
MWDCEIVFLKKKLPFFLIFFSINSSLSWEKKSHLSLYFILSLCGKC